MMNPPILYSFRRCPYAIRARMALAYANIAVELREILLKDKPMEMLAISSKGTVPILVLDDGQILDQSVAIMRWALIKNDQDHWLSRCDDALLLQNDGDFKYWLDRYKYSDRYPEQAPEFYKDKAEVFIHSLEHRLEREKYLGGDQAGFTDVAIFPFVRQFAGVDPAAFQAAPFVNVQRWLNEWLDSKLFLSVMDKHPVWQIDNEPVYLDWVV